MDPNVKNALIVKKIIYAGTANTKFTNGTKVYFHFQTRLCDSDHTMIDDSRKMGSGKPMELVLGKKFQLEVWETIIQKMSLNEVASFTVDKRLVVQYPFISKTLRDANKPAKERNRHCCGGTLQNNGVGYDDLTDMLKKPVDLEFIIEIVKVEQPEEYQKESWQLTEDEKLEMVPVLREKGNASFKNKDYESAANSYVTAIGFLQQLMLREKPNDTEWLDFQKQTVPLLLNFAQCKLIEGDYYAVIEHCTSVLKIEPDNVKALFRRGKAHVGAWKPSEAQNDFNRVIQLDKSLTTTVQKELKNLDVLIKERTKEEKEKLKNLFTI